MPDFIYKNKVYYNSVEFVMDRIGGTWKMPILWRLSKKVLRYGELRTQLVHITDKMLSSQLKELEQEGFIKRTAYPVIPPRVEYSITKRGKKAIKVIEALRRYGTELMKEFESDIVAVKKKE